MNTLKTKNGQPCRHIKWADVNNGDMVHVLCSGPKGPYAKAGFQVIDNERRILTDINHSRTGWFYCIPEWLYVLEIGFI